MKDIARPDMEKIGLDAFITGFAAGVLTLALLLAIFEVFI